MEDRTKKYAQVHRQAARVRGIYSQIGEPLAADVIVDLYLHLGKALDAVHADRPKRAGTVSRKPRPKS